MKKIFLILFFTLTALRLFAQDIGGDYYVATDGDDNNAGTYAAPFKTWQKAVNSVSSGDTVYIRGGVYYTNERIEIDPTDSKGANGTYANPTCFFGYPGEWPILDCIYHCDSSEYSYNQSIKILYSEHLYFKDFEIRNVHQCTSTAISGAITASYSRNFTFEHIIMHDIGQRGYWMESGAWKHFYDNGHTGVAPYWATSVDTTRFINCDAYNLCDSISDAGFGNAADGWKIIQYRDSYFEWNGCRMWNYTDDGIDPSAIDGGKILITNCWALPGGDYQYFEGQKMEQNGFKLMSNYYYDDLPEGYSIGTVQKCVVAFAEHCFGSWEANYVGGKDRGNFKYFNNTAYKANAHGFYGTGDGRAGYPRTGTYYNNLEYGAKAVGFGEPNDWYAIALKYDEGYGYTESHNTWDAVYGYKGAVLTDTVTVTDADFVNIDSTTIVTQLTAPRKADGSLPDLTVFQLVANSDLIDAGVDVGLLPYNGSAPDIGAFEYAGTTNLFPTVSITSPVSGSKYTDPNTIIEIEVDASDPDGSISKVEFYYEDNNKIGESNTHPWSFTWNDAPVGTYPLWAVATDNENATTTSKKVYVTIEELRKLEITNYSPNPTTGVVTVVFYSPQANSVAITVVNSSGAQVLSMNHNAIIGENNLVDVDLTGLSAGIYTINLNNGSSSDACNVTKQDQAAGSPLVANAGQDQTVNDADNSGGEDVTLEGSGSSDSDGTIVSYSWKEGSTVIATGVNPTISLNVGTHNIALTATDDEGNTASDNVIIKVTEYVPTRTLEIINSTSSTYDIFTVSFYSPETTTISIEFFNSSGNKVKDASYSCTSGINETDLDLSGLPEGEYRVTLYDGTTSVSCYVTKQDREEPISFEILKSSPNPTVDLFAIEFTCPQDMMIPVTVFDDASRVVLNEEFSAKKGLNKVVLNLSSLKPGNYKVELSDGHSKISTTVSKQQFFQE